MKVRYQIIECIKAWAAVALLLVAWYMVICLAFWEVNPKTIYDVYCGAFMEVGPVRVFTLIFIALIALSCWSVWAHVRYRNAWWYR